jgi:hypothetical protein
MTENLPVPAPEPSGQVNYLNQEEIETLNLIVSAYLDFAELQKPVAVGRCTWPTGFPSSTTSDEILRYAQTL